MPYKYLLQINHLACVNSNYPFDVVLRIKDVNGCTYDDSPIIFADTFQCEEEFPWKFPLTSPLCHIQFIEISHKTNVQIVKSELFIDSQTDEDGEEVIMLIKRSGKKLCFLDYSLVEIESSQSASFRSNKEESKINRADKLVNTQIFDNSENKNEKLERQIANLNQSISKILEHQISEHVMFSRYLDESTSFLKQVMKQSKARNKNMEEQLEGKDFSDQWYFDSFGKNKPKILKNISYINEKDRNNDQSEDVILEYSNDSNQTHQTITLQNFSFNTEILPQQLSFISYKGDKSYETQPFLNIKMKKQSSQIKTAIELPQKQLFVVELRNENGKIIKAFLGNHEMIQQKIFFFNENGQQKGIMKFTTRKVGVFQVQTQDLIIENYQNNDNNNEKSQSMIKNDDNIRQNSDSITNNNQSQNKSDENKIELKDQTQKDGQQQIQNIVNSEKQQENIVDDNDMEQNIFKQQQQKNECKNNNNQAYQNEQIFKLNATKQKSEPKQSINNSIFLKEEIRTSQNQLPELNRKFNISQELSFSFVPFMRRNLSLSQRPKREKFLSEDQSNQESTNEGTKLTIKIDSINVQFSRNFNKFQGKFVTLRIKNRHPYTTESINLSQNLKWKGKGYIFEKVSQFQQLHIQLCEENEDKITIVGKAKICLALLSQGKNNRTAFYHEYLHGEDSEIVGQLILGYQKYEKSKSRSISNKKYSVNQNYEQFPPWPLPVKRKKLKRIKTKNPNVGIHSEPSQILVKRKKQPKFQNRQEKNTPGSMSIIRNRKYTGGNIVMGRAARFKKNTYKKDPGPGPGDYQIRSTFQRHVSPL